MYDIITFGSATRDIFVTGKKFQVVEDEKFVTQKGLCVPLGSKIDVEQIFFAMGGCGANTAVTFARQDFRVVYCGQIGQDAGGREIKRIFTQEGVGTELIQETNQWPTPYSIILSLPEVGRSILVSRGASHYLSEKDIDWQRLNSRWFYVASLAGPCSKVFEPVIKYAKEKNIHLAINPGRFQLQGDGLKILKSALEYIDILICNQEEAALLTEIPYEQEKEIFQKLDKEVKGIVVMTKGPKGVVVSDGQNLYSAGIPESDLVDRTGAGDAFGSGFVAGWIEKQDIAYAIQLGTANATACLQELGAVNGLLKKGEWGPWPKVEVEILKS
jgi:ribokinase